jgi:hypothetical protein
MFHSYCVECRVIDELLFTQHREYVKEGRLRVQSASKILFASSRKTRVRFTVNEFGLCSLWGTSFTFDETLVMSLRLAAPDEFLFSAKNSNNCREGGGVLPSVVPRF